MKEVVPERANCRPKIIFLHIHKTAGMSLRGLFVKNYRDGAHFNTNLMEIEANEWDACLDRVRRMGPNTRASYRVFKGHMPFGLHEALPEPSRYITFLRNPVRRVLSYYRMAVRKKQLPSGHQIDPSRPDWNLGAHPALARSFDNGQTRLISGASLQLPFGGCTDEHLRQAKHNLDTHFEFVGLTEQFDLSLLLMQGICGWKWRFYVPDNVAPQDSVFIPPEIEENIRILNRYDLELYRYVAEQFERLVSREGWKLRAKHGVFIFGNKVHQLLHQWRQKRKSRRTKQCRPAMRPLPTGSAALPGEK